MKKPLILIVGVLLVFACYALCFQSKPEPVTPVSTIAPEISLLSPKGKTLKLSSLRGKMVLIDFWASWCGPCRKESPNVVEAYQKYHNKEFKDAKGFEVFSVSLDRDNAAWKQAIITDNLSWKYHVLDDQGLAAANYQVATIPNAFLVNGAGEIIASGQDLRGLNLHITLDKYLK
jgi:thiol-disulfide isomerase/thioredoxin